MRKNSYNLLTNRSDYVIISSEGLELFHRLPKKIVGGPICFTTSKEDDLCNGEFLVELLLEETPFYPIRLTDGFQALKFTQLLKPKLLICDYYLPKMDGITLYDRLHSNRELQDVPALIVSARLEGHEREIKERGLAALSKPFDLEDFFAAIENVMGYDIRMPAHILR